MNGNRKSHTESQNWRNGKDFGIEVSRRVRRVRRVKRDRHSCEGRNPGNILAVTRTDSREPRSLTQNRRIGRTEGNWNWSITRPFIAPGNYGHFHVASDSGRCCRYQHRRSAERSSASLTAPLHPWRSRCSEARAMGISERDLPSNETFAAKMNT